MFNLTQHLNIGLSVHFHHFLGFQIRVLENISLSYLLRQNLILTIIDIFLRFLRGPTVINSLST